MTEHYSKETNVVLQITDCPFCDLPESPDSLNELSSPIDEYDDVLLKPDLGMLIPGHLLAITRNHYTSFAQLNRSRLKSIDNALSLYETALGEVFGRYFRIEHGSDNIVNSGSGACIEHAHAHLIPADEDVGLNIQEQLPWQQLDSYEDLSEFKGAPYIYLGRLAMHYAVPDPRLSGQWARRQVAAIRGLEQWDWAVCNSKKELNSTLDGLRNFPLRIFLESAE
jgi:diadenosine tetraphosphate (Ap4A) HIT family hydrolase